MALASHKAPLLQVVFAEQRQEPLGIAKKNNDERADTSTSTLAKKDLVAS